MESTKQKTEQVSKDNISENEDILVPAEQTDDTPDTFENAAENDTSEDNNIIDALPLDQALDALEPAAGDSDTPPSQQQILGDFRSPDVSILDSDLFTNGTISVGAIDATNNSIFQSFGSFFRSSLSPRQLGARLEEIFRGRIIIEADNTPDSTPETPAVETRVDMTEILLSHQTRNQSEINNSVNYEIQNPDSNRSITLSGSDMPGLSNSASVSYRYRVDREFRAELESNWNSIKNIEVDTNEMPKIIIKNFVHADVHYSGDENAKIRIFDAKRGTIETEDGNDNIQVTAYSNGSGWSNTFDIDSGTGNDKITVKGSGGHTRFDIDSGEGNDVVRVRKDYHSSDIDLSAGNDRFIGGNSEDAVLGGEGNDNLKGKNGDDILYGGAGDDVLTGGRDLDIAVFSGSIDEYVITKNGGRYTVEDTVEGRDGTDTLKSIEGILFGVDDLMADILDNTSETDIQSTYDVSSSDDLDFLDVIEGYTALQQAIDSFAAGTDTKDYSQVSVDAGIPDLAIFSPKDLPDAPVDVI